MLHLVHMAGRQLFRGILYWSKNGEGSLRGPVCLRVTTLAIEQQYGDRKEWRYYSSSNQKRLMNFEEYRKLKKSLKWKARLSGIPMALVAMGISSAANVHFNPNMFDAAPEEIQPILGMDPIAFAAICGVVSGIVGFTVGGAFFNSVWRLILRNKAKAIDERDEDFLARLQKHRYSGFDQSKYEDDYYAEKVITLSDYRQWIRQQQRKKETMKRLESQDKGTKETSLS